MKRIQSAFLLQDIMYMDKHGIKIDSEKINELMSVESKNLAYSEQVRWHFFKGNSYLEKSNMRLALLEYKKALSICEGDIGAYIFLEYGIHQVKDHFIVLARLEPENLELGWVYKELIKIGDLSFEHHLLAYRHYAVVGDAKEKERLERILLNLYPGHPLLNEINSDDENGQNKKEVLGENRKRKNTDNAKAA